MNTPGLLRAVRSNGATAGHAVTLDVPGVDAPPLAVEPAAQPSMSMDGRPAASESLATLEANKHLVRRFVEELWNQQRLDVADELFTADCIPHTYTHSPDSPEDGAPSPARRGTRHIKAIVTGWRRAFPDWHIDINDLFAEGDRVVLLTTGTGTHCDELMGVAATYRHVTFSGMRIFRVREGKIAEYWVLWDWQGLWRQIGAAPGRQPVAVAAVTALRGMGGAMARALRASAAAAVAASAAAAHVTR